MSFELTEDQELIRKSVAELAGKFDDHYWMTKDQAHEFPQEFYDAIAKGGWLGMTIPEEYGGHGLGITEATLLLEEILSGRKTASSMTRPLLRPRSCLKLNSTSSNKPLLANLAELFINHNYHQEITLHR